MKILSLCLLLALAGCSAVEGALPATNGDVDAIQDAFADQAELQNRAIAEAAEGDTVQGLGLYLLATISGIAGAVGLSRRRRKRSAREEALLAAQPGTPKEEVLG